LIITVMMWTEFISRVVTLVVAVVATTAAAADSDQGQSPQFFTIEGKVAIPQSLNFDWITQSRILVDGGKYLGFLKEDGSFVVTNVPPGSYVVEVACPDFDFDPARVEITSRGKMRSRRVNNLGSGQPVTLAYPLRFKAKQPTQYFMQREEWRITDVIKNPMVMMMILPVILIGVLPKLMNSQDPEIQREMQQSMNALQPNGANMPDMAEMMTSIFGGGAPAPAKKKSEKNSSRDRDDRDGRGGGGASESRGKGTSRRK